MKKMICFINIFFLIKKKLNFYLRNKINLKRKVFRKKLNLYMFNRNKNKNFYLILLKFNLFKFIEFANFFFLKILIQNKIYLYE